MIPNFAQSIFWPGILESRDGFQANLDLKQVTESIGSCGFPDQFWLKGAEEQNGGGGLFPPPLLSFTF